MNLFHFWRFLIVPLEGAYIPPVALEHLQKVAETLRQHTTNYVLAMTPGRLRQGHVTKVVSQLCPCNNLVLVKLVKSVVSV